MVLGFGGWPTWRPDRGRRVRKLAPLNKLAQPGFRQNRQSEAAARPKSVEPDASEPQSRRSTSPSRLLSPPGGAWPSSRSARMGTSKDAATGRHFQTTRWSLVLRAGGPDVPAARLAREALCKQVWYPLYGYVRRRGYGPEDAQDLVQGFFARLFESGDLATVSPARGRLRSFLLAALKHH